MSEPQGADWIVREVLEALCQRDGISLESAIEPGKPARNYELAFRLGIGRVFGLEDEPLELEWPEGSYERYADVYGRVARVEVPADWWSDEWHQGLRWKVYVGKVVGHHGGGCCLQPKRYGQAPDQEPICIPLKNNMTVTALPGHIDDHQ